MPDLKKSNNNPLKIRRVTPVRTFDFEGQQIIETDTKVWECVDEAHADAWLDYLAAQELQQEIDNVTNRISNTQNNLADMQSMLADLQQQQLDAQNKTTG